MTTPGTENLLTHWQALGTAADGGQLVFGEAAARACDKACDTYLLSLADAKTAAGNLGVVEGMGDFPSGRALALKFSRKAVGGDNNLVDVLDSHIRVVEAMQTVFRKFFVDTSTTDAENASTIDSSGPR